MPSIFYKYVSGKLSSLLGKYLFPRIFLVCFSSLYNTSPTCCHTVSYLSFCDKAIYSFFYAILTTYLSLTHIALPFITSQTHVIQGICRYLYVFSLVFPCASRLFTRLLVSPCIPSFSSHLSLETPVTHATLPSRYLCFEVAKWF